MGMFDSVIGICPDCGNEVEFQSKAGDCALYRYTLDSVPPEIAKDIEGYSEKCNDCGKRCVLQIKTPIGNVSMSFREDI
jgi:DNA-directed RNA polymerase subunit RPC12/RpoP